MVEGEQFLIRSLSFDWIRRKILLSDLGASAVNLIDNSRSLVENCTFGKTTLLNLHSLNNCFF